MPSEPSTPSELTQLVATMLRGHTFRYENEKMLQHGIEEALTGLPVTPEFRIDGRSRIDFIVELSPFTIGIEIKVSSSPAEVARQLRRYLKSDQIDGIVLMTTRRRHRKLEKETFEKPMEVVWLGFAGV